MWGSAGCAVADVVKVKVVVYENDVEKRTLTVGYFANQTYVVKIDTPDGVDRQYEAVAGGG